jgi:hypothetical protein
VEIYFAKLNLIIFPVGQHSIFEKTFPGITVRYLIISGIKLRTVEIYFAKLNLNSKIKWVNESDQLSMLQRAFNLP